mmetsp:Transcript_54439/g.169000  ORF Transcript_54439/g.169000 Transcript_54439/m.169000 type:complete len:284 (+) Transcript_54439:340-1191(+)
MGTRGEQAASGWSAKCRQAPPPRPRAPPRGSAARAALPQRAQQALEPPRVTAAPGWAAGPAAGTASAAAVAAAAGSAAAAAAAAAGGSVSGSPARPRPPAGAPGARTCFGPAAAGPGSTDSWRGWPSCCCTSPSAGPSRSRRDAPPAPAAAAPLPPSAQRSAGASAVAALPAAGPRGAAVASWTKYPGRRLGLLPMLQLPAPAGPARLPFLPQCRACQRPLLSRRLQEVLPSRPCAPKPRRCPSRRSDACSCPRAASPAPRRCRSPSLPCRRAGGCTASRCTP